MFDLVLKSTCVLTANGLEAAQVIIDEGLIVDVVPYSMEVEGNVLDVGDKILMPGVIDPHVHINEPGRTDWEGFDTATKAAIAGGVTTLIDMPLNSSPVTTSVEAFERKLNALDQKLHTNCGFWGGIVPGNETGIEKLIDKGVLGFKAFLTHSGIDEFPNVTEADLNKAMPIIAKYDLPLLVHCELSSEDQQWKNLNKYTYLNYLSSRPKEWEDRAIEMMIKLCETYQCRTHIVHLSSSASIDQIRKAKERSLPLTVETAQHYLYFNAEDIKDGQTQFKCAPPIREKANNDLLWDALKNGIIDFVATDHSPAPPALKQLDTGDFMEAWGGIASLQWALPVLWTAAKARGIGLDQVGKWLCEKPAYLIGKGKSKGRIAKGFDADIIVFDAAGKFVVTEETIQHKHNITPYLHHELSGIICQSYLGGVKVYDQGSFTELNEGKVITRI
jgi:allantoinase